MEIKNRVEKFCILIAVNPNVAFLNNKLSSLFSDEILQMQYCRTQSTAVNMADPTKQFLIKCKFFPDNVKTLFDLKEIALGSMSEI